MQQNEVSQPLRALSPCLMLVISYMGKSPQSICCRDLNETVAAMLHQFWFISFLHFLPRCMFVKSMLLWCWVHKSSWGYLRVWTMSCRLPWWRKILQWRQWGENITLPTAQYFQYSKLRALFFRLGVFLSTEYVRCFNTVTFSRCTSSKTDYLVAMAMFIMVLFMCRVWRYVGTAVTAGGDQLVHISETNMLRWNQL